MSFGGSVQVTWDTQTLRLSRCASISACMGLLLLHTLHFLRPVTTVSIKMAAVSSQEQMKGDQHHFSLRRLHRNRYDDETDSYFGEDWLNQAWFWGQITWF